MYIEAAVESRQRFGDVIGCAWLVAAFLAPAGSAARVGQRRFRDSLDMARQVVETIVDRRELLVRILVVIVAV